MQLAASMNIEVIEKVIKPEEIYTADEAFFTGTAAEVAPIRSIDDHVLGAGGVGPITNQIKTTYLDTVYGKNPAFKKFLTYVEK